MAARSWVRLAAWMTRCAPQRVEQLDAAVMDVNLAGERIFPVAEMLWQRAVPFLLLSGYGERALPEDRQHWRLQAKPFEIQRVLTTIGEMIAQTETKVE